MDLSAVGGLVAKATAGGADVAGGAASAGGLQRTAESRLTHR